MAILRRNQKHSPEELFRQQLQPGDWRIALQIGGRRAVLVAREEELRKEMRAVCLHFSAEHAQIITLLDTSINSSGLIMLLARFKWTAPYFFLLIFLELFLMAVTSSLLSVYCDWDVKAATILAINSLFGVIVYYSDPFVDMEDRWMDHIARVLVNAIVVGLITCDWLAPHVSKVGTAALTNKWNDNSLSLSHVTIQSDLTSVIDLFLVVSVYAFVLVVLVRSGVLHVLVGAWHSLKYGFHTGVLDFVVGKLQQISIGNENVFTGLSLVQQWDSVLDSQRQRGVLSWPQVRPPHLATWFEKLYYLKWSALWNLDICHLKSSLGLTLLHVSMSEGNSEVSRWLVHRYPTLLSAKDHQGDTPIVLALREAAKFLIEYSKLNYGLLDDGSSYDDEYFNDAYPDVQELRDECAYYGDFVAEKAVVHTLTATELNQIEDDKKHIVTRKKVGKDGRMRDFSPLNTAQRYPEDGVYEDKDSGSMVSWGVLDIDVPTTMMYADALIEDDESVNISSERIHTSDKRYKLPSNHPAIADLPVWDIRNPMEDGLRVMSMLQSELARRAATLCRGGNAEGVGEGFIADTEMEQRRTRWSACKFLEVLLSPETRQVAGSLEWDLAQYKTFNQMANRLQGKVCQHLAYACHLNPPNGFAVLSEWSEEIAKDVFDEGTAEDEHVLVKTVLALGKAVETIGNNLEEVRDRISSLLHRKQRRSKLVFSDRTIQYLSEALVCSTEDLSLKACQLSGPGRVAWRAICRALRRRYCSFILPSTFIHEKNIVLRSLCLQSNGLDCADCILLAEVVKTQQQLKTLELSYNRIGARGMLLLCKAIRGHRQLAALKVDHNRIGPAVGVDIESFLAENRTLKVVDLSYNVLGPMTRYSTRLCFEHIPSAGPYLFRGVRANSSIEHLDLSYNNLRSTTTAVGGEELAFLQSNTTLHTLIISGNDFGPEVGPSLLLALAGYSFSGMSHSVGTEASADTYQPTKHSSVSGSQVSMAHLRSHLRHLVVADNQLGPCSGDAIAAVIRLCKFLSVLDVSGNAIGSSGGVAIAESVRAALCVREKEIATALAEKNLAPHPTLSAKKPKTFCMHTLNLAHNALGPKVCSLLMDCVKADNGTIISLDLSGNPLGHSADKAGSTEKVESDVKDALAKSTSIAALNMSGTGFSTVQLISILGGLAVNQTIVKLCLGNVVFDSPSCLQISRVIEFCSSLRHVDLRNGLMGPNGAGLVCTSIERMSSRLEVLNLSNNKIGSIACVGLGRALVKSDCAIQCLLLGGNDLCDGGCDVIARSLLDNDSITELDLSNNGITFVGSKHLSTSLKGKYSEGKKISNLRLTRFNLSQNPGINSEGAQRIISSLAEGNVEHVQIASIGAGQPSAALISKGIRDLGVRWRYLDCSDNSFGREGLNSIFWSLRVNRRLKVVVFAKSKAGLGFGTSADALGIHGISLFRAVSENTSLVVLSLAYNNLSSIAGSTLFNALQRNSCIRRIALRGNMFDDAVAPALEDLFIANDMIEHVDLGDNKLGYRACGALASGLMRNRAVHTLIIDGNRFGNSKSDAFTLLSEMISFNNSLKSLRLDNNRIGSEGGVLLAQSLSRNSTIISISLEDNRFDSRAGLELVNAYKNNLVLVFMVLTRDEIGAENYEQLCSVSRLKRSLRKNDERASENEYFDVPDDM